MFPYESRFWDENTLPRVETEKCRQKAAALISLVTRAEERRDVA
jgi:hypothetical protein